MKSFKFYIALWCAKTGKFIATKVLRRNGSILPGKIALKICPDFIGKIEKPRTIIAVTGTNGKTTVCNMIEDVLRDNGYDFIDNKLGANVNVGVATTLINGANFLGKTKKDLAVLEIDERSSVKIYPYLTPTYLICTNLFRDSMLRNAHSEFISNILTKYIPKKTKLILNADDLISCNIAPTNKRVYFGIDKLTTDEKVCHNIVNDMPTCPKCDFSSPKKINYEVTKIDFKKDKLHLKNNEKEEIYDLITNNIINIYNMVATISLLREFGLTNLQINNSLKKQKIVESRYLEEEYKEIKIISHLAKGMNPIACSRVFEYIKKEKGNKAVILILDDLHDSIESSENISWHYDTDFEFLNDDSIKQIIVTGVRHLDTYVRLRLADIPKRKIEHMKDEIDATKKIKLKNIDSIYILYDVYTVHLRDKVKDKLKEIIDKEEV